MSLNELERTLLDAARNQLAPSDVDRERHQVELLARMAGAPAWQAHLRWPGGAENDGARAPFLSGVVARLPAAAKWPRLKSLCVGLVVGAVLGGVLGFGLGRSAESAVEPDEAVLNADASARVGHTSGPGAVSRVSSSERSLKALVPINSVVSEPAAPRAASPRAALPPRARSKDGRRQAAGPPESSLAVELAMLQRARRALNAQNGRLALGIVQELDERFPKGLLVEERSATRILSLCMLERAVEARRFAGQFLDRHPGSVYAQRVRQSCVADLPE